MLQPLGWPLCLPSHLLSSIRLNTFLHPYLSPKNSLLYKASLAAHLLHLLYISIFSHSLALIINVLYLLIN